MLPVQLLELKIINLCSSVLGLGSLCVLLNLYSCHNDSIEEMVQGFDTCSLSHFFCTLTSILSIIFLLVHQHYSIHLFKKSVLSLLMHLFSYSLSPVFPSSVIVCVPYKDFESCYSLNEVILVLMLTRFFCFYLALLQFTKYFDIYSFTKLKTISATFFASKCVYTEHKIIVTFLYYAVGNHLCAYLLTVFERRDGNFALTNLINANWCALISGFTIGIGDLYPVTLLGRLIITIWIFFGAAFSWYFILAASNLFTMSISEYFVYKDINKINKAAKVVSRFMAGMDFQDAKKEFNKEKSRQYISPNNYGTFIIDIFELPPHDYRMTFARINQLDASLDSLYTALNFVNLKFTKLFGPQTI